MSGTQSSVASVTVAGVPDIQFVNADFLRQQLGTVDAAHKGGASLTTIPVSTQVKLPRGSNLYHASLPEQVVVLKTEKEGTPSPVGDPPPPPPSHTTKSSSLSRDISPSRITAQVVSAMSESSQPLLLSALTGKMPTPLMMGAPARPEALQDVKHKQAETTTLRTSPHSVAEQRSSPAHADGQAQMETKAVKTVRPVQAGLPFESLMQVASLALEMHSGSSPGRHQVGLGAQLHGKVYCVDILLAYWRSGSSGCLVELMTQITLGLCLWGICIFFSLLFYKLRIKTPLPDLNVLDAASY